jgi:nitrate/TMAO reductase-like tetraheme cytochrome c subunit
VKSKRAFLAGGALALLSVVLMGADRDLGTGYELENVEVLDKSMRLADARRYMIEFNDALGVTCRDCHDLRDFADDGKEMKLVAREMMKMQRDLNERWFPDREEDAVTCFTCHRGSLQPAVTAEELATGEDPAPR